ncbi:MAG: hypothetical protein QXV57_08635 [Thermoproteota archaeon]
MKYNCRIPCKIPIKNIRALASELSKQGLCLRKYSKAVSKLEAKINVKQDADLREQKTLLTRDCCRKQVSRHFDKNEILYTDPREKDSETLINNFKNRQNSETIHLM